MFFKFFDILNDNREEKYWINVEPCLGWIKKNKKIMLYFQNVAIDPEQSFRHGKY